MQRRYFTLLCVLAIALFAVPAGAEEVTSRMRTVSGAYESGGYRIEPVYDVPLTENSEEKTKPQAYEIMRPDMDRTITIGRLFTSCSCIRLEAEKRSFGPGERAILVLRNVRATPADGQMYAFFVQMREPLDTTLRFDTFVKSGQGIGNPSMTISDTTTPAPVDETGNKPVGNPVPGLNNQLAAALSAVGGQAEATAGLLDGPVEDAAAEEADNAAEAVEAREPEVQAAVPTADLLEEAAEEAEEKAAEESKEVEAVADPEVAAAAAAVAQLTEEQVLQLQQLALLQAEEQAKQLADRVQQLHDAPAGDGETAASAADALRPAPGAGLAGRPSVQAVSLITIGVKDMTASIRFYEALGWQRAARGKYDQTAFFQLNGQVLALYPVADLLAEQNMADAEPAPGGITLALHVTSKEEVTSVYQRFIDAGGKSLRAPAEMASGAVSSYVTDPDGNPWEISWVPQFTLDANGGLWLP